MATEINADGKIRCEKCKTAKIPNEFYKKKDGTYDSLCKKCLTAHVDPLDEATFLWILERFDVPYAKLEWDNIKENCLRKKGKMSGRTVLGKYFALMRLNDYKGLTYKDTPKVNANTKKTDKQIEMERKKNERLRQRLENGEISEAVYATLVSPDEQEQFQRKYNVQLNQKERQYGNPFNEDKFISEDDIPDISEQLTLQDKQYLAVKWGRLYNPNDWVRMEKNYNDLKEAFEIQDPDSLMSLVVLCKANNQLNKALEEERFDDYNKIFKSTTDLRKTLNITAAQAKNNESEDDIDCVGKIVEYCEAKGGRIPRFKIKAPVDVVDTILKDLTQTTKQVILDDPAIAPKIEEYLRTKTELIKQEREELARQGITEEERKQYEIKKEEEILSYLNDDEHEMTNEEPPEKIKRLKGNTKIFKNIIGGD